LLCFDVTSVITGHGCKSRPTTTPQAADRLTGHLRAFVQGIPTLVILLTKLVFSRKHAEAWKVCYQSRWPQGVLEVLAPNFTDH
jgi:hypothetical protein